MIDSGKDAKTGLNVREGMPAGREKIFSVIICIIASFGVITVVSKSSFLYPLNDWTDANCFLTVGKSLLSGKVLYRDIYDQKGPLFYFLYALAALVSRRTFTGAYILEVIAASFFLYFAWRILRLYCGEKVIILVPLLGALVYSTPAMTGGGSAEEFCLPLLEFALFVSLRALKDDRTPSVNECFVIGLTSGFVLWSKYTFLAFYLGWIVVPLYLMIKGKNGRMILKTFLAIIAGVLVISLPVIIYFAANHGFADLYKAYFYNNIFVYNTVGGRFTRAQAAIYVLLTEAWNPANAIMIIVGLLWMLRFPGKRTVTAHICFTFFPLLLTVYGGRNVMYYYPLILSAFSVFGLLVLQYIFDNSKFSGVRHMKAAAAAVCVLSILLGLAATDNSYLLKYSRSELPQYRFAAIMNKVDSPTLLNYGFLDGGFYTAADIVPSCRYFCGLIIELPELIETQDEYAADGKVDFIVTKDRQISFDKYTCVDTESFLYEKTEHTYYLYELNSLAEAE